MKIAVMGYGTIGSGVVEVLEINKEKIAKRAGEPIPVSPSLTDAALPAANSTAIANSFA